MKLLIKKSLTIIFNLFYKIINNFIPWLFDSIYERKIYISIPNTKVKISYRNFGPTTRWRAKASLTKERNTIKWIDSFEKKSSFLDVGAHMGIFTLYAAKVKECYVVAVEPSSITSCLLNLNICDNNLSNQVKVFSAAAGNNVAVDEYHMTSMTIDAGSGNPFKAINARGENYQSVFSQGIVEISLDQIFEKYGPFDHIKIDIDGNENKCLDGAELTLKSKQLKSILIELNENEEEYSDIIEIIKSYNFVLDKELTSESLVSEKRGSKIYNHIFYKQNF
jgi:FkbM family methyltransferase